MSVNDSRPVSELFSDAVNQFSKLMRNEIQLAQAEMSMKVGHAMTAVALLAGAAVLSVPTLVLLLMAFAAWLVEIGMRPSIAHLTAGAIALLVVAILTGMGLTRLKTTSLVPKRTLNQLQQDAAAAKEHV